MTNTIIGITGLISSGKDTAADYLTTVHGFKRLSFAGTLKDAVAAVFGWDRDLLEGSTKASRQWREQIDPWWAARLNIPNLTPRYILQQWGTNVIRINFHDQIWVASIENRLRNLNEDVVITDCRFANEIAAIKNLGGITMRTNRGPKPDWHHTAELYNCSLLDKEPLLKKLNEFGVHASEYSSVGLKYDYHLDNNGTITDLHNQIQTILDSVGTQK